MLGRLPANEAKPKAPLFSPLKQTRNAVASAFWHSAAEFNLNL